jgi:hypothetical protein
MVLEENFNLKTLHRKFSTVVTFVALPHETEMGFRWYEGVELN